MNKNTFKDYTLAPEIIKALDCMGYTEPTLVQQEVLPIGLEGKNMIVQSKTGSGKTLAFGLPICQCIDWEKNMPQALILVPTRELAIQVQEELFNVGRYKRLKVVTLIGKTPFEPQRKALKQKTHIVVGTPGRVLDHVERGNLILDDVSYFVLDEADEMLKMGFMETVDAIKKSVGPNPKHMLFSATMPENVKKLAQSMMSDPVFLQVEVAQKTPQNIEQKYYKTDNKIKLFNEIMINENPDCVILFCNTRNQVDDVTQALQDKGYRCAKLHGGMEQRDRQHIMENFKKGFYRYLVATDVAARGIDVDHVTHVVNYDVPDDVETYTHRIGRTGRNGRSGKAIVLV
ncbi:MAG: DEAD/DEAH box helicase, partial [Cellulosilyticaceae bacterium]